MAAFRPKLVLHGAHPGASLFGLALLSVLGLALSVACLLLLPRAGQAFPGFVTYQDGCVVPGTSDRWSGALAGLGWQDRVLLVDGRPFEATAVAEVVKRPLGTRVDYTIERELPQHQHQTLHLLIATERQSLAEWLGSALALWLLHYERIEADGLHRHEIAMLKQAEAMRTQFLSLVSHELRAPLAATLHATLLARRAPSTTGQAFVTEVHRNMETMAILVDDLLRAGQMQSGAFQLACVPLDVSDLFEGVTAEMTSLAEAKSVVLRTHAPMGLPEVQADEQRLKQVLRNLVHNAIKFSPPGGAVDIVLVAQSERLLGRVTDQGQGVALAERAQLFTRFGRLSGAQRADTGVGLGLYIVKSLVEAHGGEVGLEETTSSSSGASFWFSLPILASTPE